MEMDNPVPDDLLEHYKLLASGAQKLAACIDVLLPALARIEQAKRTGGDAKELGAIAHSALTTFEEVRGQKLSRVKLLESYERAEEVAAGEALHTARSA